MFALLLCSLGVFALSWCVCSPWGGGTIIVPPPCPGLLACVLTPWCGLEKRVRGCCVPDGRRAARWGRNTIAPPHALLGGAATRCVREEGEKIEGGALSWCANTRAHTKRGREEGESLAARTVAA